MITAALITIIVIQAVYILALQRSPMGVLTPTALRLRLALLQLLRVKCFVIGIDIRKMKSLNECLGYGASNQLISRLLSVTRKRGDVVGQFGGDEFVIAGRNKGDRGAELVIERLLAKRDEINAALPLAQRERLAEHTDGLIDGLHVAVAYVTDTTDVYTVAGACVDATEPLKAGGRRTGERDTSGRVGTLVQRLGVR